LGYILQRAHKYRTQGTYSCIIVGQIQTSWQSTLQKPGCDEACTPDLTLSNTTPESVRSRVFDDILRICISAGVRRRHWR
jgi:hypothetical protein